MAATDSAIETPTDFRYAAFISSPTSNVVKWQWRTNVNLPENSKIWFFVRACETSNGSCVHTTSRESAAVLDNLFTELVYEVQIFAHVKGPYNSDPVLSSEPLRGTMKPKQRGTLWPSL